MFTKTLYAAAFSGLLAGLLLTVVQQIQVIPLIHHAEIYELANEEAHHTNDAGVAATHEHEHEHTGWQPQNGWERNLYTVAANIVIAVGFALLLGAAVTLRGAKLDWRSGLLWGLASYAVFFIAPSLGLPPEVPGTQAAALLHRQLWWLATVICTASGLAFIVFLRHYTNKIIGVVLLLIPHWFGAPHPEHPGSTAPAELANAFIIAASITNAIFWLSLGGLFGFFQRRLAA